MMHASRHALETLLKGATSNIFPFSMEMTVTHSCNEVNPLLCHVPSHETAVSKMSSSSSETCDLPSFMTNPAAQMLKNFGKLVCVSLFFLFHYFKPFFRLYSIKILYIVLAILLLRSFARSKIQATVKACA